MSKTGDGALFSEKGVRALFPYRATVADRRATAPLCAGASRGGKKGSDPFFRKKGSDPFRKACAVAVLAALAACGQKGPLVLPERASTVPSAGPAVSENDETGEDGR
jgi:predicted small lipoprotein YifL